MTKYCLYEMPTSFCASGLEASLARAIAAGSDIVFFTRSMKAAGFAEMAS